jgi:hypothetical protein
VSRGYTANRLSYMSSLRGYLGSLLAITIGVAASLTLAGTSRAAQPAMPRLEIANAAPMPGESLRVYVTCASGTGAADLRSPVTGYAALDPMPGGRLWFSMPMLKSGTRTGVYHLVVRCTPGPGSPYATTSVPFRVFRAPVHWIAASTTAESITGDARFSPDAIAFAAGGRLRIRYVRDVWGSVSILGDTPAQPHAQLYRVLSRVDLKLRAGNMFCGKTPAYLTTRKTNSAPDADIVLTVYSGSAEPRAGSSGAICASYTYAP